MKVAAITSDNSMHDGQLRGRVIEGEQFPKALFTRSVTAVRGPLRNAVVGTIAVQFADCGIENASKGAGTTEDDGLLEFDPGLDRE